MCPSFSRRHALGALGLSLWAGLGRPLPAVAAAGRDAFPAKPIRLVVPAPPGGTTDLIARVVAEHWAPLIGQAVLIENIGGAAGSIGSATIARAARDGYSLLFHSTSLPVSSLTQAGLSYDPLHAFAPISLLCAFPLVMVVSNNTPAKNLQDLLALLKAHPQQYNYGSSGYGGIGHLVNAYFTKLTGVEMLHVPYKGGGPAIMDLIGGRLNMFFDGVPSMRPHIASGRVRALAVTSAQRSSALPQVPTMAEGGQPGFNLSLWQGIFAPAGTPPPAIQRLSDTLQQVMHTPAVIAKMAEVGASATGSPPGELGKAMQADVQFYRKVIADTGIKISNQ